MKIKWSSLRTVWLVHLSFKWCCMDHMICDGHVICCGASIVPITSLKSAFDSKGKSIFHSQLLLWLAWAITVYKSQGLTLTHIHICLGNKEFAAGLTFVALFYVKSFAGIMIVEKVDLFQVKKLRGKIGDTQKHLDHMTIFVTISICTRLFTWILSRNSET